MDFTYKSSLILVFKPFIESLRGKALNVSHTEEVLQILVTLNRTRL